MKGAPPLSIDVTRESEALERMTMGELRRKYREVFGHDTRSAHKGHLRNRIIWQMQANVFLTREKPVIGLPDRSFS